MSRRKRGGEDEEENIERWTTSYMDMVTVMMCLFIVLFAISQVDQQKFSALRDSLAVSFGQTANDAIVDGGSGVLASDAVVPEPLDVAQHSAGSVQGAENVGDLAAARQEVADFTALQEQLRQELASRQAEGNVTFSITDRGLVIGLVSADVYFGTESAELREPAMLVVDVISPVLAASPYALTVEGHANTVPTARYPTNWELSSDRATQVLRRMVESGGVPANRVVAVGMGDAYPMAATDADPLEVNKRVDIVVLSDAPDTVRDLIPQVVAEMGRQGALPAAAPAAGS
ncbi:MAG: flagellar motor protein MotB [Georgenia sp.]